MGSSTKKPLSSQVKWAIAIGFLVNFSQMSMNPLLAPLSREIGLKEVQLGLVISLAAVMVTITSRYWGRLSQEYGAKRILKVATTSSAIALFSFATVAQLGKLGMLGVTTVFILFMATRGMWHGTSLAAMSSTVQTYVALNTPSKEERVRGMAGIGAAQGFAMILGAGVAGVLGGINIMMVLWLIPLANIATIIIAVFFIAKPESNPVESPAPQPGLHNDSFQDAGNHVVAADATQDVVDATIKDEGSRAAEKGSAPSTGKSASISPFDPRLFPYVTVLFLLYSAFGFVQILLGFIIQDRYLLDSHQTASYAGILLLASGTAMLITQGFIVPKLQWHPNNYIKLGTVLTLFALSGIAYPGPFALLTLSIMLMGFGLGMTFPGANAGASLVVEREEQGATAGTIGATLSLTFIFSPVLSSSLYMVYTWLPNVISVTLAAISVGFAFFSKGLAASSLPEPETHTDVG